MPQWLDKILEAVFGGTYETNRSDDQPNSATQRDPNEVAMDTFRRRISTSSHRSHHERLAPGFDYIHWKPYGKRRRRYIPGEYFKQARLLMPYVKDVAYTGYLGLEEKRWAGIDENINPIGIRGPRSAPRSLQGSRDLLERMGAMPPPKQ